MNEPSLASFSSPAAKRRAGAPPGPRREHRRKVAAIVLGFITFSARDAAGREDHYDTVTI